MHDYRTAPLCLPSIGKADRFDAVTETSGYLKGREWMFF
jgi:hypothetical protein